MATKPQLTVMAKRTIVRNFADFRPHALGCSGVAWAPSARDDFIWLSEDAEAVSLYRSRPCKLKQSLSGQYLAIGVGERKTTTHVHRLMAETWFGPAPFAGAVVRHLDGDRFNNRLGNLAWGTPAENAMDQIRHGTSPRGERNGQARLTRQAVGQMRRMRADGLTFKEIAEEFGVAPMTAHRAVTGRSWK